MQIYKIWTGLSVFPVTNLNVVGPEMFIPALGFNHNLIYFYRLKLIS